MANFVRAEQDPKFHIKNMPVNIEDVKAISKSMNGFYFSIVFEFNETQSFEWRYRFSNERDNDYKRLSSLIR